MESDGPSSLLRARSNSAAAFLLAGARSGMPSTRFGSGDRLSQTSRWLGGATPGKSPSRPSRSVIN